jgi:hypothetical protein
MRPAALSPEPLILFAAGAFLFLILPLAIWITLKWTPKCRATAVAWGS